MASPARLRTDGFSNIADIIIGSFDDPDLDEGYPFEEWISFHGGPGGPQTRPFLLYLAELFAPEPPIVGAAQVHAVLASWRRAPQGDDAVPMTTAALAAASP